METAVHGLAREQARWGHHVEVVTLQHALDDGRGLPHVDHEGVRYVRVHRIGPRRYPFAWGLKRAVTGADLVHVHGLDGLADRLVRARHRPLIGISTHGAYLHSKRLWALKQGLLRSWTRQTLDRAESVWFTSEVDRSLLAPAGVDGEVVPNGVDLDPFLRVERFRIPGRWLVLGRVDRHKGIEQLIDALPHLDPRIHLELVGPDAGHGWTERLRRRAGELRVGDRIHLRGEQPRAEVLDLLGTAELALFPSRHEAFGIAVVEAMAAGCPVVVSDIEAHRALVTDEVTGFVLDMSDPRATAARLQALASSGPERVSEAGREAARAHGWDRRLEAWNRAYARLLARRLFPAEGPG